jgi:hypothetical protein
MLHPQISIEAIEEKRKEMIKLAGDYGFTSRITVQASQELDLLLNAITDKRQLEFILYDFNRVIKNRYKTFR